MDSNNNSCCIQEASSDAEKPLPPTVIDRMGSGTSAVVDPADAGVEAESRKLPSSQYKGVVPQPNGRWGAQIYEKHQRVWLGTFNGESDAAKAYDVAAQRFRGRDAVTNFKPLADTNDDDDVAELAFLNSHSKVEIVDMLRKHTYHDELCHSKRTFSVTSIGSGSDDHKSKNNILGLTCGNPDSVEHLFDKTVTPSDVGKLNRLVIPKQHAEKHFPLRIDGDGCKGLLLTFEDSTRKIWRFRYSYWNSSQSYVLTKGWSRFVKEKSLTAGDVVSFRQSKGEERQLYIDCKPRARAIQQVVRLRLFGVNIFDVPREVDGDAKKRTMQHNVEELMPSPKMFKKQRVCILASREF